MDNQYFAGDGSALTDYAWANSATSSSYGNRFVDGNIANFTKPNGTGNGTSITVSGIVATENFTLRSPRGTISNTSNGVIGVSVSGGKTLDFGLEPLSSANSAGYIKNDLGAFATVGGTFAGGFTLNAGTIVARDVAAMGRGGLIINGGTIAGTTNFDFSDTYSGITIGGNFQFGTLAPSVSLASQTGYLAFGSNVALGTATRTITIGANGTYTLKGVLSGSNSATGLMINAASGATGNLTLTNANTYQGGTTINSGTLLVTNASGSATGTGSVTVNNSGTILGGTGFIDAGADVVTVNGILSPGVGTGSAGAINIKSTAAIGALTLSSTSTLAFDITNTATKDLVALDGSSLALNGGTLALKLPNTTRTGIDYTATYPIFSGVGGLSGSGFGSVTGYDTAEFQAKLTLTGSGYNLSFVPIPEPSTILSGALMIGLLGWSFRRRMS